jgi:hypothetical protein
MLHRAAVRGLEEAGRTDFHLSCRDWESYCNRASNVGSRTQQHNLDFRLETLGLIQVEEDGSVIVLKSDYSDILLDE